MSWRWSPVVLATLLVTPSAAAQSVARPPISDQTPAVDLNRRITVRIARMRLDEALELIGREAGVIISYGSRVVPVRRAVSYRGRDVTVRDALAAVLAGTGVVARVVRDQIVLVRARETSTESGTVVGRVVHAETGEAVREAEILLEQTDRRATTDSTGAFRLVEIEPGPYVLVVRRVGYTKQSRPVTVETGKETSVVVTMTAAATALDELVTTATGEQRRRDLGNAITTIRADSVLRSAPIRNLTDLLEDRVPGLTVQHTSGAPGDPARLRLRGISSAMRGNDPVVIVDGARIYAAQSDRRSGNLTNLDPDAARSVPAPSPLDQIDPNIIEKIEVFKGPSAATLYGADAANGVIVITTKKGQPGVTRWNASLGYGRTVTPGRWPVGYFQWGRSSVAGEAPIFCTVVHPTCEVDSLVRSQALNDSELTVLGVGDRMAGSITASGGSQALTYSVTGSYNTETGLLELPAASIRQFRQQFNREPADWMRTPHQLTTWSVTSNVRALLGPTADVTLSTSLFRSEQQRTSLENQLGRLAGTYVDRQSGRYYLPTVGSFYWGPISSQWPVSYQLTPSLDYLADYYQRTTASSITFTTGLNGAWRPKTWLNLSTQAGISVVPRDDERLLPGGLLTIAPRLADGSVVRGTGRSIVGTWNLQGSVRRPLRWGFVFETNVGANIVTTHTRDLVTSAFQLVPGTSSIVGAKEIYGSEGEMRSSVFGWYVEPRITGQRFALSTGLRLDGGSSYGTRVSGLGSLLSLPKLNGSWVISEERWFPLPNLFSSLRLRGGYGQAQVQPGPEDRLRLYTRRTSVEGPQLDLTTVGNRELRPERSTEIEGGFDADLLDSRVSVELTLYRKTQVDALMPVQLPPSVNGGASIIQNIGNIRNTGTEVTLGVTPLQSSLLTWNTQLNFSRNTNTLVKLGRGVDPDPERGLMEGYPVNSRWARPIKGYADLNGDGLLTRPGEIQLGDSLVFMGRLLPDYQTAVHTNVVLFDGALGITATVSYDAGATQIDRTARTNWPLVRALVDRTAPLGEQAAVLVADSTEYGITHDISTLRWSSFSVNYRAPAGVARLLRAQQVTVAVQGSNLGLRSSYGGKDPDVSAWSPSETIMDTGQLPQPRTWQLSLFLQY